MHKMGELSRMEVEGLRLNGNFRELGGRSSATADYLKADFVLLLCPRNSCGYFAYHRSHPILLLTPQ
jgi:hypothetical protein